MAIRGEMGGILLKYVCIFCVEDEEDRKWCIMPLVTINNSSPATHHSSPVRDFYFNFSFPTKFLLQCIAARSKVVNVLLFFH